MSEPTETTRSPKDNVRIPIARVRFAADRVYAIGDKGNLLLLTDKHLHPQVIASVDFKGDRTLLRRGVSPVRSGGKPPRRRVHIPSPERGLVLERKSGFEAGHQTRLFRRQLAKQNLIAMSCHEANMAAKLRRFERKHPIIEPEDVVETCIVCGGSEPCSHDFDKQDASFAQAVDDHANLDLALKTN